MRFRQVNFSNFGPFESQSLDFALSEGLQVVFGPNEAGKSSALRGLRALLFGFPTRGDNHLFDYKRFRIRATIALSNGQLLECVRRKGDKDTLRKGCDKVVIPENTLREALGGLEAEAFEQLYGLDADRLRTGGQEMVTEQGEFGKALFAAGAGMKGLRILRKKLEDRQQELYKQGGQNQVVATALAEYGKLKDEVQKLILPAEVFEQAVTDSKAADERARDLNRQRSEARERLALLQRYRSALPTIDFLRVERDKLRVVADAPLLKDDFAERLQKAIEKRAAALNELKGLDDEEAKIAAVLALDAPPTAVLNEEAEIVELRGPIGANAKSRDDELRAKARSDEERDTARDIYRELTGTTEWDAMDRLKPKLEEQNRITKLAGEWTAIVENLDRQNKAVAKAKQALDATAGRQSADPGADNSALIRVVNEIAAEGPIERQSADERRALDVEKERLAAEFACLQPKPDGAWRNAMALPVPLSETVEAFRQALAKSQSASQQIEDETKTVSRKIAVLNQSSLKQVGTDLPPTEADLSEARRDRDDGLQCIRLRLDDKPDDDAERAFRDRHAPGRPLIDAFEVAVRQSDTVADRLRREADSVAAYQQFKWQQTDLQSQLDDLRNRSVEAMQSLADIEKRWQAIWKSSGIAPETPAAMQAWLVKWSRFRDQVEVHADKQLEYEANQARIAEFRDALNSAYPPARDARSLVGGLALAKDAIAEADRHRANIEKAGEDLRRETIALQTAEREREQAIQRKAAWETQWREAVAVLRLTETMPSIETAQEYLRRIEQMQKHLSEMRIKRAQVKEIVDKRGLLVERLTTLRRRIDPACSATTADSIDNDFRVVENALKDAIERRTLHQERSEQIRALTKKRNKAIKDRDEAAAALIALASEAGVDRDDAIAGAMQSSRERAIVTGRVRDHEAALAPNLLDEPMESFIANALVCRATLNAEILELDLNIKQLDSDVSEAEAIANKAKEKRTEFQKASSAAADANQRMALIKSRIQKNVIEYAALHVAITALNRAISNYREQNQDNLLGMAGEFFRTLTSNAFSGIEIENDNGEDVLKAVRADSDRADARVMVSGLSDGTRDQLFLALRLAGIQQHLKEREPVPLIVDDVLVNFDDDRSRATLACLAELARDTQVVIFTHHRHLVEIAKSVDASASVHELA